jgi:pimeloyl-ACP methyl ester carboxylesterase
MMPLAVEESTDECSISSKLSWIRLWLEDYDRPVVAVDQRGVGEDVEHSASAVDAVRHNVRTRRQVRVGIIGIVGH